jgi:glutamate-1-semialdehyde 2,1-aminomutase
MSDARLSASRALLERAKRVVPGGIYGHQSPRMLVDGAHPFFFTRAKGAHVWDADGNEYIDYMCSYGPIVLGHDHPVVRDAALAQAASGDCFSGPSPLLVELAEHLVGITPFADWALFGKNGSDVCTYAVQVARAHTERRKVAMAQGAYHGCHAWCNPLPAGITAEDRANVVTFTYNDLTDVERVVTENRGDLAAIILTPFRHDTFHDQELPVEGFLPGVRQLCDREGIVLVLDDVRAGFRLHLGGSGEAFGIRPDLAAYAKAIANGYPISACAGRDFLRDAAKRVYFTGSYFTSAVAMAAALACLREIEHSGAIEVMKARGSQLRNGIEEQACAHGIDIVYSGPPAIPFLTFAGDESFQRSRIFSAACARAGVYLAPYHNWFLSAAHSETDIARTLDVTDRAFAELKAYLA